MEPVLTNALATVTMALLTSVAALFSEGVAQYRAEHYEQAVASFTKVVETAEFKDSFTEPALLFRAQAYVKLGKKDLGVKDLDRLLTAFPGSPFREVAASEYKGLTGEPWRGLDLSTPEAAWASLLWSAAQRDAQTMKACLTGEIERELMGEMLRNPEMMDEWSRELQEYSLKNTVYNKAGDKACGLMLRRGDSRHSNMILFVKGPDGWRLSGEPRGEEKKVFQAAMAATGEVGAWAWQEDRNHLRQLQGAVEQYIMEHGRTPERLQDTSAYLKDIQTTNLSLVDGQPFVLGRVGKGSPSAQAGSFWIYMSKPVEGKRQGIIEGQVQTLEEKDFRARAAAANVKVSTDWQSVETSPEQDERIQALIDRLGAVRASERRAARQELKAIGAPAGPLLEKATRHDDPEIALTAEKLLQDLH